MKRVLIVGDFLKGSGMTKFIMNTFPKMDPQQIHIDAVNIGGNDDCLQQVTELGWKFYTVTPANQDLFKHLHEWKHLLSQIGHQYDIIHFNYSALWNFFPILYAHKFGVRHIIMHSHNTNFSTETSNKLIKAALTVFHKIGKQIVSSRLCSGYLACSEDAARWFYTNKLIRTGQVKIIRNGIDAERFAFNRQIRETMREQMDLKNQFVIGHIGVFERRKNHQFLMDVFDKIHKRIPDSCLLLIGRGPLENQIREQANQMGLRNSVRFLGLREDVPDLLQAMDAFVFPSHFEGLGIVLLEAQASGLMCFASKNIPDEAVVTDQVERISLDQAPELWAERIIHRARDYNRESKVHQIVEHGYSSLQTANRIEAYYSKLD